MRKTFAVVGLALLGTVVLGNLALAQPKVFKGTDAGKFAGAFRNSSISDPKTFNPFVARETSSTDIITTMLPGLTQFDPYSLQPEGYLAKSWEVRNGGLTVVFKLEPGAKWSDGKTISADDVIFSATVHADPKVNSNSRTSFVLDGKPIVWSKVDATTVKADFPKTFAPALLQTWLIVPKHIFEESYKAGKVTELWGVDTKPDQLVAGGPFLLESYAKGERVTLKKNPNFWGVDEKGNKLPYLERYTWSIVPNQEAQLARFIGGEQDIFLPADADKVAQILDRIKSGRLKAEIFPNADVLGSTNFVVFNWNNKDAAKGETFRQLKFRKAMAHLMDKKAMIEVAMGGLGRPLWSPIVAPAKQFFTDEVVKFEYSPQKAVQLLAEMGYNKKDKDGFLVNSAGKRLEFNLTTNQGNSVREKMAQLFAEDANKVGVKVNFRPVDFNELVRQLTTPGADGNRDFDAILIGLTSGPEPDSGRNTWLMNAPLHAWNLGPKARFEPFELLIEKVFTQGATTLDQAKRRQAYVQFQKVVAENLPLIYLVSPSYNPARTDRSGGLFDKGGIRSVFSSAASQGQYPYLETVFTKD
jgi:peptide/nickel transport system substrate-binding protein